MSRLEAKLKTTSVNKQGKQSIAEIEKSLERMKTVLEDGQLMSEEEMLTGLNKLNFLLKTTNQHSITLQQISSTDLVMIERIGLARRDLETLKQRIQQKMNQTSIELKTQVELREGLSSLEDDIDRNLSFADSCANDVNQDFAVLLRIRVMIKVITQQKLNKLYFVHFLNGYE